MVLLYYSFLLFIWITLCFVCALLACLGWDLDYTVRKVLIVPYRGWVVVRPALLFTFSSLTSIVPCWLVWDEISEKNGTGARTPVIYMYARPYPCWSLPVTAKLSLPVKMSYLPFSSPCFSYACALTVLLLLLCLVLLLLLIGSPILFYHLKGLIFNWHPSLVSFLSLNS